MAILCAIKHKKWIVLCVMKHEDMFVLNNNYLYPAVWSVLCTVL